MGQPQAKGEQPPPLAKQELKPAQAKGEQPPPLAKQELKPAQAKVEQRPQLAKPAVKPLAMEELMSEEVKQFIAEGGRKLFVSGFSKYQTQESLSDFFALIPPKPEQVILFPNDQKGKTLEHPFAFAVYKSDEDT